MLSFSGSGRHVFDTAVGPVGLAWTPQGVCRIHFGSKDRQRTTEAMQAHCPHLAPSSRPAGPAAQVVRRLKRHLAGHLDHLLDIPVYTPDASEFARKVWRTLRKVPPGTVVTYGELALKAGRPGAARAVGRAMAANPVPLIVPCHRCVGSDGSMTGFSTEGGVFLKKRLLFIEGYEPDPEHAAGIRLLQRRDPVMRRLIKGVGPYQAVPDRRGSPFDTLVTAIVHQQLSVKAGRTIAGRVRDLTPGPRYPGPGQMLALTEPVLRGCGLSRSKTGFVKDLAARVTDGRLKLGRLEKLSDEEVIAGLTQVHGIGVWSAQMHLIFHLGRLDVLPTGDLGLQHAAGKAYGYPEHATAAQLTELGERWKPYRSLASWYLWRSLDAGGV